MRAWPNRSEKMFELLKDWIKVAAISSISFFLFVVVPFAVFWLIYQGLRWALGGGA